MRLIQGPKKRLAYSSFGTNDAGMDALLASLARHRMALQDAPFDVPFGGIWFQDPHSDRINVEIAEPAPSAQAPGNEINVPGNYRHIRVRACGIEALAKRARPRRLGHLIKFSPGMDRSVAFYTEVLGLKVSDRAQDILAFLRGSAGGGCHSYDAAMLLDASLCGIGGTPDNQKGLIAAIKKARFTSLRGPFRFDRNNFSIQNYHIFQIVRGADGKPEYELQAQTYWTTTPTPTPASASCPERHACVRQPQTLKLARRAQAFQHLEVQLRHLPQP